MELATIGSALSLANSAKSLLGGLFGGSKDEGDSMKSQYAWNAYSTYMMPTHQVAGLRKAGLNPMLAVGKGIQAAPSVTASPGADDAQSTARQSASTAATLAAATVENMRTSSAKNLAEAELTKAQTENERNGKPGVLSSQAALNTATAALHRASELQQNQLTKTEGWQTKLKELDYAFQADTYSQRVRQVTTVLASMVEDLKLAQRLGKINESEFGQIMGYIERARTSIFGGSLPIRGR